ncbi:transcriptional regulator [Streptomyces sp. NRRL F-6602]|nr:transcriptional regulator [Streptomyces sp. NRRL F-6602]
MTGAGLARAIQAAAGRRGLRSGATRQRVYKWEVEGVIPDPESQILIADAFGIPVDLVDPHNWPDWLPAGVIPLDRDDSTVPALREALRTTMTRSRRTFLSAISGAAVVSLADSWAAAAPPARPADGAKNQGQWVDEEVVRLLEDTSSSLMTQATEQRQHTAPLLLAYLERVTDLIENSRYSEPIGLRLHGLAAHLAQTAAWHRFDLGRHDDAITLWNAGLHAARATHDHDLGAAMLGDLAYQASWRDDPRTAAGILKKALTKARHPAAQSLLHLRLARALAAQGERRETLRALTAAEHFLQASSSDPKPAWCAWLGDADLAVDSGQCLLDLGDTRRAAHRLIGEGSALLPRTRDKTRGVFLAYRAHGHLRVGEPEEGAAAATEALLLAERIGAPRCVQLVRNLVPQFKKYPTAEGVPEFLHAAAA